MRRKELNKKYYQLIKETNEQIKTRKYQRDEEGRVIINMVVEDDSGFLSPFSETISPSIATDVADFLENETKTLLPKELLTLRIKSNCIDENEQKLYEKAIKEHYTKVYIANEKDIKRNKIITLILFIIGVIVLSLAITFKNVIWSEVIDIAAWVFLWEAVDIYFFKNRFQKMQRFRYLSFISMNIEYYSLSNEMEEENNE